MFAPPPLIDTQVFAEVPHALRKTHIPAERVAAAGGPLPAGSFVEGPSFDRAGNLYFVDIPYGRIFRASPQGKVDLVAEYGGEPNGLRIHKDGRIFVADHRLGIMLLDPDKGSVTPFLTRYHRDLTFASNGDLYFTDQGQTDMADRTGRVYRYTAAGVLQRIADALPSPNGLVLSGAEDTLFVAVTRGNAIWRLPLAPDGTVARIGVFIQLSGGRGPDGIAIDENDGLVVSHPDMGAVWIFNHRGEPAYRVQSCASDLVTNVAFGGADRKTLYIADSGSGCILMAKVPTPGRLLYSHM
jgi:gluconolactonase